MKEIKKILVLALILIFFIGCGSSPSGSSSSTVQNNNQSDDIAYFAYTSNYDHQNDMVLKTDGTLNNTSLVSNSLMSTNSNQEIGLYDFKIFSNHLYITRSKPGAFTFNDLTLHHIDLSSNLSTQSSLVHVNTIISSITLKRFYKNSNIYVLTNYINPPGGATHMATITKINSNHQSISLTSNLPNNVSIIPYYGSVEIGDDIYFSAQFNNNGTYEGRVIKLDTLNDTFTVISAFNNITAQNMAAVNNKLYLFSTNTSLKQLYKYDPLTNLRTIINSNISSFYENESLQLVYNNTLYFKGERSSEKGVFALDTLTNNLVFLSSSNRNFLKEIQEFNGEIYYNNNQALYKSDGITANSSSLVHSLNVNIPKVYKINNKLYFAGELSGSNHGIELLRYDGTTVSEVIDINPGSTSSYPYNLININQKIVFQVGLEASLNKVYSYDGSTLTQLYP